MKFSPINKRVLIKPIDTPDMTDGGLYIPDQAKERPSQGHIVAAAVDCEFVKEGEIAMYGKFSGNPIVLENSETGEKDSLVILNEKEILGHFYDLEEDDENEQEAKTEKSS